MGRRPGQRNADFAESRARMLSAIRRRMDAPDGLRLSLREIAAAADVSVPTLRYYFGDRAGVLRAIMERDHQEGSQYLTLIAHGPLGALTDDLVMIGMSMRHGFAQGLGRVFVLGFAAGAESESLGRTAVAELIEPTLQAVEARFTRHMDAGHMRYGDVRVLALQYVSPLLLLLLHQHDLSGATYRAMDLDQFVLQHAASFAQAHAPALVEAP
jgi:AcrR family transcriptional regulator